MPAGPDGKSWTCYSKTLERVETRGHGPLRARVGAPEHAGRDPTSPIGQAQEGTEDDPRLRQAAPTRREPLSSGVCPICHPRTVPLGHLDGNRGPQRVLFTRVRGETV